MIGLLFKIWYLIAILPFLIFIEGSDMFKKFLKKRNIYGHWDLWHSYAVLLIIIFVILWVKGYR